MPTSTFSSAVMLANRRMFWKVRAMPASAISCGVEAVSCAVEEDAPSVGV